MRFGALAAVLLLGSFLVGLAVVLGASLGIGWVLSRIVSFTLFEGTFVAMLALVITGAVWRSLIGSLPDLPTDSYDYTEGEDDYGPIPVSRFVEADAERTWRKMLAYEIANDIYVECQEGSTRAASMDDKQLQELSVRLADIAVAVLESARGRRLRVTKAKLKRQMNKMGQRPYDDDILDLAVRAINSNVDFYYDGLVEVIRDGLWDELVE
jgi:hypothetical protein